MNTRTTVHVLWGSHLSDPDHEVVLSEDEAEFAEARAQALANGFYTLREHTYTIYDEAVDSDYDLYEEEDEAEDD